MDSRRDIQLNAHIDKIDALGCRCGARRRRGRRCRHIRLGGAHHNFGFFIIDRRNAGIGKDFCRSHGIEHFHKGSVIIRGDCPHADLPAFIGRIQHVEIADEIHIVKVRNNRFPVNAHLMILA